MNATDPIGAIEAAFRQAMNQRGVPDNVASELVAGALDARRYLHEDQADSAAAGEAAHRVADLAGYKPRGRRDFGGGHREHYVADTTGSAGLAEAERRFGPRDK